MKHLKILLDAPGDGTKSSLATSNKEIEKEIGRCSKKTTKASKSGAFEIREQTEGFVGRGLASGRDDVVSEIENPMATMW